MIYQRNEASTRGRRRSERTGIWPRFNEAPTKFAGGDAEALWIKHQAVESIEAEMRSRGVTEAELATETGLKPSRLSEVPRRKLDRFSIGEINRVLAAFGYRVAA